MNHPDGCACDECVSAALLTIQTEIGQNAYAFLRWLKDMDIGVNLCHLHSRDREELSPDEWEALIREWEDSDTNPGMPNP
jgi:hypothetical protein